MRFIEIGHFSVLSVFAETKRKFMSIESGINTQAIGKTGIGTIEID